MNKGCIDEGLIYSPKNTFSCSPTNSVPNSPPTFSRLKRYKEFNTKVSYVEDKSAWQVGYKKFSCLIKKRSHLDKLILKMKNNKGVSVGTILWDIGSIWLDIVERLVTENRLANFINEMKGFTILGRFNVKNSEQNNLKWSSTTNSESIKQNLNFNKITFYSIVHSSNNDICLDMGETQKIFKKYELNNRCAGQTFGEKITKNELNAKKNAEKIKQFKQEIETENIDIYDHSKHSPISSVSRLSPIGRNIYNSEKNNCSYKIDNVVNVIKVRSFDRITEVSEKSDSKQHGGIINMQLCKATDCSRDNSPCIEKDEIQNKKKNSFSNNFNYNILSPDIRNLSKMREIEIPGFNISNKGDENSKDNFEAFQRQGIVTPYNKDKKSQNYQNTTMTDQQNKLNSPLILSRMDRRGICIFHGGKKHKVSFVDQIGFVNSKKNYYPSNNLIEVVDICSYKKFNGKNTFDCSKSTESHPKNSMACCLLF